MRWILLFALLTLTAPWAMGIEDAIPDRSFLWESEEAFGHALPDDILADWPRDAEYGYDVDHIHLDLAIDFGAESIAGSAALTVTISEAALTSLPVDLDDALTVSAVRIDGLPAGFSQTPDQIIVTLAVSPGIGEQLLVAVDYHGSPQEVGNKSLRFDTHGSGLPMVYALSTPYSNSGETVIPISHHWRPCKDVPDDKSTFSMNITVPDHMLACANGVMTADVDNGDGTRSFTWEHNYPVAPYLVTLAATDYLTLEETYNGPGGTAAIQHFVYPERYSQAQESFNIVVPVMEIFAEVFGEYPFIGEKYGMFSTPAGPAVEEQTMVAYPYNLINGGHTYDWIIVHELAHMWWGDCVTCEVWAHVWLNEGFASYAEALWKEALFGWGSYHNYMIAMDDGPYVGAIYDPPYVWHPIVYNKGAWILHMLRNIMGDTDFFQMLLDYRAAHEQGSAVTEDLVAVCEGLYGGDLDWFFEPWIYHEGRPTYEYGWTYEGTGPYTVHVNLEQVQSPLYPTYTMPIDVEISLPLGSVTQVIWNTQRFQSFDLVVHDLPIEVDLDPNDWILAEFTHLVSGAAETPASPAFLAQNVPNPFNPRTAIRFGVSREGRVALRVFDARGRMVRTLLRERLATGEHTVYWDGKDDDGRPASSGLYFYRLAGPDGVTEKKMLLLR